MISPASAKLIHTVRLHQNSQQLSWPVLGYREQIKISKLCKIVGPGRSSAECFGTFRLGCLWFMSPVAATRSPNSPFSDGCKNCGVFCSHHLPPHTLDVFALTPASHAGEPLGRWIWMVWQEESGRVWSCSREDLEVQISWLHRKLNSGLLWAGCRQVTLVFLCPKALTH